MQDPETYLKPLDVDVACAVHPDRPAVLDRDHRYTVGYETFFVSDARSLETLKSDPARWGWITDPVSKERFRPNRSSPRATFTERLYVFANAANQTAFEQDPGSYAHPKFGMLPMGD